MKHAILGLVCMVSDVQSVGIHVIHPTDLKNQITKSEDGLIESAFGLQGHVDYGEGFFAKMVYPSVTSSNTNGCREFESSDFDIDPRKNEDAEDENSAPERHPVILMDEGDCSYAVKSANAESFGFKASFISAEHRKFIKIKVGTDGAGGPVGVDEMALVQNRTIPEFTILRTTADFLTRYLRQRDAFPVYLKVDLSIPHPDNKVEVEIWYSSLLDVPDSLLRGMRAYMKVFKEQISFTPRIATFSCEECHEDIRTRDCVSNGKYCAFLPQHDSFPDIPGTKFTELNLEGRHLVLEALAQRCTWQLATEKDPELYQWWLYLHNVRFQMVNSWSQWRNLSPFFQDALGFTSDQVQRCVDYSFDKKGEYDSGNSILKTDREYQFAHRIHAHPAVTINQQVYKGDLIPVDIAHAICAGFKDRPRDCRHKKIKDLLVREEDWDIPEYGYSVHNAVIVIGLVMVGANILLLGFCKWRQNAGDDKAVVEMEVNQQVQNYFALRGEESNTRRESQ